MKKDDLSQLQAPPPKWGGWANPGAYTSHRADIDLIDWSKNEESKKEDGPHYVAIMQDRASRYIWTRPLKARNATDVTNAFEEILDQAKEEGMDALKKLTEI